MILIWLYPLLDCSPSLLTYFHLLCVFLPLQNRAGTNSPLNFAVVGGWEVGQPIFVHQIEPDSIPLKAGLRVGDQVSWSLSAHWGVNTVSLNLFLFYFNFLLKLLEINDSKCDKKDLRSVSQGHVTLHDSYTSEIMWPQFTIHYRWIQFSERITNSHWRSDPTCQVFHRCGDLSPIISCSIVFIEYKVYMANPPKIPADVSTMFYHNIISFIFFLVLFSP